MLLFICVICCVGVNQFIDVMEDVAVGRFVKKVWRMSGRKCGGGQLRHLLTSVQPKMMINIIVIRSNSTGVKQHKCLL